jgi:hypothetical protein
MRESNPAKKQPQSYGGIFKQGTLAELLWDFFLDNCLEIDAIMGDISFFMGLLITSNIQ